MGKVIELTYNGKTYNLEFNRRILATMYKDKELQEETYDSMIKYVWYAFQKNHSDITYQQVVELTDEIGDLAGFVNALKEITESAINTLNNGSEGNAKWGMKN